jgi:hypothetical protein
MAKKYQKLAAARARAHRHKPKPNIPLTETIPESESFVDAVVDLATDPIDVDWQYNCGYNGGVNREDSETEYQPGTSSDESESGAESLDDLSGDELELNLQQQRERLAELAALMRPTPYSQIRDPKTVHQWAKAEANRALGYNGQSGRTKRRKDKEARDREAFRKQVQTS